MALPRVALSARQARAGAVSYSRECCRGRDGVAARSQGQLLGQALLGARQAATTGRQAAAKGFKPLARQAAKSQAGRQAGGAGRQAGRAAGRQKSRQAGALRQAAGRQAGGQGGGGGFSSERRAGRRLRARVHTPRGEDGIQGSKGGLNVVWHINAPSVHS